MVKLRNISRQQLIEHISKLCIDANYYIEKDIMRSYKKAFAQETSSIGKKILDQIIENVKIAKNNHQPMCQDTGFAVVFVELGIDVHLDFDLQEAIDEGVRQGYKEGYLRKSIVKDPLQRINTKDNTPAIIHLSLVSGNKIKVTVAPKGGGSENMSAIKMLKPSDGVDGVKNFVIDTVDKAGANACPPVIVGVGLGGTFEKAAILAKKSLLREIGSDNTSSYYNNLEKELLESINNIGIGPMGLGGKTTALDVFINVYPCHIASMPVAVNIQCHSARHKSVEI